MDQPGITLVSFGFFEKEILDGVAEAVRLEFDHPVRIREGHVDISEHFDAGRRQYNANKLLHLVDSLTFPHTKKTIGLFNIDLFIPILTYIFGQAALGGHSGIASLYRLNNEYYGMEPDKLILMERFRKEVVHELGHTFGLIHCNSPICVMRSSTYVEDIDQKEVHLCPRCSAQIKEI